MIDSIKIFLRRYKKYLPVAFFAGGFLWDSLTLGRIDSLYSNSVLFLYLAGLTAAIYLFNRSDDGIFRDTRMESYQYFFPLAIQFFLGGLSSAYVIFYFQSVSLTKSIVFFLLLVVLLLANELLKHRISNKYLQFSAYFFVLFTFFIFFLPVLLGVMSTLLFILAGLASLTGTVLFIRTIYRNSPSTRKELHPTKIYGIIAALYLAVNIFYYFNLIPPVPLSLQSGIVAKQVERTQNAFVVTYHPADWPARLWRPYHPQQPIGRGDSLVIFTSIFAPADLETSVFHRWKWKNPRSGEWIQTDRIGFEVIGGRRGGFRGYTYKSQLREGQWQVDVITDENLLLGTLSFSLTAKDSSSNRILRNRIYN